MQNSMLWPVTSRPTVNFTEALAAASSALTPPFATTAINGLYGVPPISSRRFLIRAISYLANEDVGLEWDFFSSTTVDSFLARYQFTSINGIQAAGAGLWRFYVDGLAIPYFDADSINSATVAPTLHVSALNVDTVAKTADAVGALTATFWLEPMSANQS